ncbi:hypothetical protein P775_11935 [Puniceibacterium antarcticum]|uniref:Uncharacterized protein n=1 Tax=Puniceibacterium antarcticum TaxID=1206336 RepID=A0A2G8REE7_9RHOB|nr:hypothetical protein P775_11935 [Puniceibacterium antarcticum]
MNDAPTANVSFVFVLKPKRTLAQVEWTVLQSALVRFLLREREQMSATVATVWSRFQGLHAKRKYMN